MNNFFKNISAQLAAYTKAQKIGLVASGLLVAGVLYGAVYLANRVDFQVLYSELDPQEAQAIVQKLRDGNIQFQLSGDGRSISIPADKISETRIQLASSGLPSSGRIGFEIFDQTTFGLTNFQEQVNYQRALEGELARSIMTLTEVEAARVHLVLPKDSLFQSPEDQAKASVILKLKAGRGLSESGVQGIVNVVASSVKGLLPERVTLIDYRGKVLSRPEQADSLTGQQLDARRGLESELAAKIVQILEPAVGQGKVRPQVSVAMNVQQIEETTERYDPAASVVRSSQRQEERQLGRIPAAGIPGPRGAQPAATATTTPAAPATAANGAPAAATQTAQTTQAGEPSIVKQSETTNYEVSKSVRHTVEPVATINKVSVAVLIDNKTRTTAGENGDMQTASEPRTPEEMTKYKDLVAAAVGFNEQRGDRIIVENISFEGVVDFPAAPTFIERQGPLIVTGLRYLVVPLVFLLVYFLFLRPVQKTVLAQWSNPRPNTPGELPQTPLTLKQLEAQLQPAGAGGRDFIDLTAPSKLDLIRSRVAEQAQKDPESVARLVRTWINEDKK